MNLLSLAATAANGEAAGGASFPPFDPWHFPSQLFWLAILFGALYIALSRFILPKLGGVIENREDTIADSLDEAARLNEQSKEAEQQQALALAEGRAKARSTADKAREKVEAEIAAETAKIEADVAERLAEAEARIQTMRTEAMSNVEQIATSTTQAMLARLGIAVTEADARQAVARNTQQEG
jgi:F-type H+-transporting ATPase subunit b